jgi:hypothetical protein
MSSITQKSWITTPSETVDSDEEDDSIIKAPKKAVHPRRPAVDLSAVSAATKRLLDELDEPPVPPPGKKHKSGLTSYQEMDLDRSFDGSFDEDDGVSVSGKLAKLQERREQQIRRVKEVEETRAEIVAEMREIEERQTAEWRRRKGSKNAKAHLIELAPTDPSFVRPKRSLFLVTITDNSSIIDPSLDTCELWTAKEFDDLATCYRSYFSKTPLTSILRPGNNIKTASASARAINDCVLNAVFRVTRERATKKGQAHLHILASIYYVPKDGFYPQIDTDNIRRSFKSIREERGPDGELVTNEKRFYVNVKYCKDAAHDVKYYMTPPPGEKQEFKKKKYPASINV